MFVVDWIHWLQGTSPSSGACCRIFGPGILMKHWGFNIEYSQQYELSLSGKRVYLAHFLWQFQWGKWWWTSGIWINVHIQTTQWFQTLLRFQTLRWFKLTLTFSGWVRNHKQNHHHHHPALQRLPMDIFPRFSKHLWPLQSQQKAGNRGCGSCRSTNVWGLVASPYCLFHGALPWTTCPLEPLNGLCCEVYKNWVVADCTNDVLECGSMTLFDTWDLVVTVCM
jgi:hypothetical protein